MEIRVGEVAGRPLGSASFVDVRLPEHEARLGQGLVRDTLAIHVRPRVLRRLAKPGDIRTGVGRLRLNRLSHVGLLHVDRGGVRYIAYLNPADSELHERVHRIRARGYFWLCMYDRFATFGMVKIGPLDSRFMESILEVRDEAMNWPAEVMCVASCGSGTSRVRMSSERVLAFRRDAM